jgi:tetratricopeptide (TPR) repeat protein
MRLFEWRRAYEEFATAIDMDPNEPNAWQRCGEVLIALHQLDAAEQYLRKALELNPHCVDAVVNFGELYLQRGDYQHARECFETALSYDPTHRKALQGRATLNVVTKLQS